MVHTGEFFVDLNIEEDMEFIKVLEELKTIKDEEKGIIMMLKKVPMKFGYRTRLYIFVDFIKLLDRANISQDDIDEILEKINFVVKAILNRNFELILNRIDYRYDVVIVSEKARKIILEKLLYKCQDKASYMTKIYRYKTNIRYFAKSKSNNIYDKELQRRDKGEKIEDYEEDIIRFEAQVKCGHLRYKSKIKNNPVERELTEYLTMDKYKEYMGKMIIKVVGKGDFYNLYHATKIINKSTLIEKYKLELVEFLKFTSQKRSLSKTYEKYGRYKYNKYIKILEDLNINPIVIPEKEKVTYIPNPLRGLINSFEDN